jgi:hypothetical protein
VKPMSVTLNSIKKLGNRTTKLGTTFQRLCNNKISMLRPSNSCSFWRVTSSSFLRNKTKCFRSCSASRRCFSCPSLRINSQDYLYHFASCSRHRKDFFTQ